MSLQKFICLLCLFTPLAQAGDWTQWRGPGREGHAANFPKNLPESLTTIWDVEVGEGHAAPLFYNGKIYLFSRDGEEENLRCLDPKTGKTLWQKGYQAPYTLNPAAVGHGKGPKSTPVAQDGLIFTFGIMGALSAFKADTGELAWQKTFEGKYKRVDPLYGHSLSPLVYKNKLLAHVGGHDTGALAAFDVKTGDMVWHWDGDGPGYASPIVVKVDGVDQLITQTQKLAVGLDIATGKLLWELPLVTVYDQNSITPVASGNTLFLSGLDKGTFAYKLSKSGVQQIWHNSEVSFYMSTPVIVDGDLYGMANKRSGNFVRLNGKTGEVVWNSKGRQGRNAALVAVGDKVMALTTTGNLKFFSTGSSEYEELKDYQVSKSPTWAHPAVDGNRILVKSKDRLILLEVN